MMLRSYADLRRLTRDLEAITDWKSDLASRLRRAHLHFECIGLDLDEQDALEAEAENFIRVCRAMSASFARTETERGPA